MRRGKEIMASLVASGTHISVSSGIGFLALFGVSVQVGVVVIWDSGSCGGSFTLFLPNVRRSMTAIAKTRMAGAYGSSISFTTA